jgi:hypothetical protein
LPPQDPEIALLRSNVQSRLRRLVLPVIAACGLAVGFAAPAAAEGQRASTARLDAKGMQLVDSYLQRSRQATTTAGVRRAGASAERIYAHLRGADATYSKRSIDTIATYVVRAGMPDLKAELGTNLVVYNDSLGYVTKANLFELMKLSPNVLHRIRDAGTTIHIGDRPITAMGGLGSLEASTARGHDAGEKWADIGGVYDPAGNVVAAGRGNAAYTRYTGTILHELGHAYDDATNVSADPAFRSLQQRIGRRTSPYYAQAGDAGPQEYFADLCRAYWTGGTAKVEADFGREAARWMTATVPR